MRIAAVFKQLYEIFARRKETDGVMNDVFRFAATFKEYPPRSEPPSFNPANIMEETLREIKAKQKIEHAFPMLRDAADKAAE